MQRAGAALAGPYTRLEQQLKAASVVNIDETGWKTAGGNRTLWGALSSRTAVFRIAAGRHAFEARTLLGERFPGIVCSDRWRGYDYLDPNQRQLCWAHLLRDFTAHSEGMAEQKQFGSDGLEIARDLFATWDSYQADAGDWWLILVGVAATAVSLGYYLNVVRWMYMRSGAELRLAPAGGSPPRDSALSIAIAAAVVVTVGSFFVVQPILDLATDAASSLPF